MQLPFQSCVCLKWVISDSRSKKPTGKERNHCPHRDNWPWPEEELELPLHHGIREEYIWYMAPKWSTRSLLVLLLNFDSKWKVPQLRPEKGMVTRVLGNGIPTMTCRRASRGLWPWDWLWQWDCSFSTKLPYINSTGKDTIQTPGEILQTAKMKQKDQRSPRAESRVWYGSLLRSSNSAPRHALLSCHWVLPTDSSQQVPHQSTFNVHQIWKFKAQLPWFN